MANLRLGLTVAAGVLLATGGARAAVDDPAFSETVYLAHPDLVGATGFAWAPDGSNRLFVTVQSGAVRVIKDGALLPAPFATVSPLLVGAGENGLNGIAFDPNFAVTKHVYFFATVSFGDQQIIRYTVTGDLGTDKTVVLDKLPSGGYAHSGGAVGVGPDGRLYFAIGDNTTPANAENLATLAGKVGRVNLDGSVVSDNPLVDGPGGNNDHVFALGFRNPFSFAFQPGTGLLWVGSVGSAWEQIFVVRRGDNAGWGTSMYENNQPSGFIRPVIKYLTNSQATASFLPAGMAGAVRAGGIATFTTANPHRFTLGERITIIGNPDPSFNTISFVRSIPTPTSFTMTQPGPDATSGGGYAATEAVGGCVTGGNFYDVTGVAAVYRANYLFGDYNSGKIYRATLDPQSNAITSTVQFGVTAAGQVDVEAGPDSALYFLDHTHGSISRVAPVAASQAIFATPAQLAITEGQPRVVTVRLAQAPVQPLTVTVTRQSGDTDVAVAAGQSLTFDSQTFARPQAVTFVAGRDLDTSNDTATFTLAAAGAPSETIVVAVRDENPLALQLATSAITIDEGASGAVALSLSAQPALDVVATATRASGDAEVSLVGSSFTFTRANWATPQMVMVAAAKDGDGADDQAIIRVAAPGLPPLSLDVTVRDLYVAPDTGPEAGADPPLDGGDVAGPPDGLAPIDAGVIDAPVAQADAADAAPEAGRPEAGRTDASVAQGASDDGCGCRVGGRTGGTAPAWLLLALGLCAGLRRVSPGSRRSRR